MSRDEDLFLKNEKSKRQKIILRFYSWKKPAISFGYRQDINKLIDVKKAKELGIELVKRITGGGMVFHQPGELTYCLIAPLNLFSGGIISSYKDISELIIKGLSKIGIQSLLASRAGIVRAVNNICFIRPTKYEILVNDKKLVGSAQKRGRFSLLQHGSIALNHRLELFDRLLDCRELDKQQISVAQILDRNINYKYLAKVLSEEFK